MYITFVCAITRIEPSICIVIVILIKAILVFMYFCYKVQYMLLYSDSWL